MKIEDLKTFKYDGKEYALVPDMCSLGKRGCYGCAFLLETAAFCDGLNEHGIFKCRNTETIAIRATQEALEGYATELAVLRMEQTE